jgi:hypothetical protein
MRGNGVAPRWVWIVWLALAGSLLLGLGLWIAHGVLGGVPGPIVAGVYVDGAVDVAVLAVYIVTAAALATVAAVMVARVPENRIGWILGGVAVWMVVTFLVIMMLFFLHEPGDEQTALANWLGTWTFVLFVPTALVLMIFPTGTLPSPRWGVLPWLAVAGTGAWAASEATGETMGLEGELPNPYANPEILRVAEVVVFLLLPALIGMVASLVLRYRRSSREMRLQIKWVALGGALQVLAILLTWSAELISPADFPVEAVLVGMLSTLIVPIALGVAILKYRLYEIDRLVSRTVSYAVLGALLAGVFFGGVIGIQALFGASNDLAVAGTTLAVAALFDPLRRRLHGVMDRRFNRRRFDAERVVEAFTARISTVTTTEALSSDLTDTLDQTLAPASFGIWIRA